MNIRFQAAVSRLPWFRLLIVLLLLPCHGCLHFEKQTIAVAFPRDRDEVRVLLVYEGFCVGGGRDERGLARAKEELARLIESEKSFYLLSSWMPPLSLTPVKDETETRKRLRALLGKHVAIRTGGQFLNKDGKLCAYQTLTIHETRNFVTGLNTLMSEEFAAWAEKAKAEGLEKDSYYDRDTLNLILGAAKRNHTWLRVEPGRISFTHPGKEAFFTRVKHGLLFDTPMRNLQAQLAAKGTPPVAEIRSAVEDADKMVRWLSELPLSIDQRKESLSVSLGYGEGLPFVVPSPFDAKDGNPVDQDLLQHARTLKVKFRKDVTTKSLIEEFLKEADTSKKP